MAWSMKEDSEDAIKVSSKTESNKAIEFRQSVVEIAAPMAFWTFLLLAALAAKTLAASGIITSGYMLKAMATYSGFILSSSGMIVLPLIVGAIVGAEVGNGAGRLTEAAKAGLLNGVYAAMIYSLIILIIYEVLLYAAPVVVPAKALILNQWIAVPVVVLVSLSEIFALVSHARRMGS